MSALAYHRLPRGWELRPLKRIAALNPEVLPEDTDRDWTFPYVDIGNVTFEAGITGTELVRFADAPSRARRRVRNGDTIVSTVRTYLRAIAPVSNQPDGLIASTGFAVIRARPPMDAGYLSWALRSNTFVESVVADSVGVSYPAIAPSVLGSLPIPAPPPAEQRAIADFLDRETAKIDALIATQERLIALLDEKRQATITHAVTKGLDPTVPMKDSGVEWMGNVPAGWQILPLGRIARARCDGPFGSGLKSEHYSESGVRVIRLQNIRLGYFDGTDSAFIDEYYYHTELAGHDVCEGDVLIAGLGDDRNTVGRACTAPDGIGPAMVKADCFRFRLDTSRSLPAFVATQLTAGAAFDAGVLSSGSTRSRIPLSVMATRKVTLPPIAEQRAIADFLDELCGQISAAQRTAKALSEELRERRTTLITAAVTGQIDVSRPAITEAAE